MAGIGQNSKLSSKNSRKSFDNSIIHFLIRRYNKRSDNRNEVPLSFIGLSCYLMGITYHRLNVYLITTFSRLLDALELNTRLEFEDSDLFIYIYLHCQMYRDKNNNFCMIP